MHPAILRIVPAALTVVLAVTSVSCTAFEPIQEGDDLAGDRVAVLRRNRGHRSNFLQDRVSTTRMVGYYLASAEQKSIAKRRFEQKRAGSTRTAKSKGAKYVAVPVPRSKKRAPKKATRDVMVLKADTGEPVDDKVYEVKASPMNDSVITVGGHDALLFSGYQGI